MDTVTKTAKVSGENSKVEFLHLGPLGLANHACPHQSTITPFRGDRERPTDLRTGLSESDYTCTCRVEFWYRCARTVVAHFRKLEQVRTVRVLRVTACLLVLLPCLRFCFSSSASVLRCLTCLCSWCPYTLLYVLMFRVRHASNSCHCFSLQFPRDTSVIVSTKTNG